MTDFGDEREPSHLVLMLTVRTKLRHYGCGATARLGLLSKNRCSLLKFYSIMTYTTSQVELLGPCCLNCSARLEGWSPRQLNLKYIL